MSLFLLEPELAATVIDTLGFSTGSSPALDDLADLYLRWCRTVPFDNVHKRIFQSRGAVGPVPGQDAATFWHEFLRDGTGGTCWSTTVGLVAVARACGFSARLVAATMLTDPELSPNHASCLVTIAERTYLLDTSMLFEEPLELRDQPTGIEGLHATTATPLPHASWRVDWFAAHHRSEQISCLIDLRPVREDEVRGWHDRTRQASLFNDALYIRRNRPSEIISYGRGKLMTVREGNSLSCTPVAPHERPTVLHETFGLSVRVIAELPPDTPGGAAFL